MLKGISPLMSPELLALLYRMGHGDELVLADAHFPGNTLNKLVLRADGLGVASLLDAILPLYELDAYVDDPVVMMSVVEGDTTDPSVEQDYSAVLKAHAPAMATISYIDRFAFYDRASKATAVIMSGETRKYGNIIIKKGVTPC